MPLIINGRSFSDQHVSRVKKFVNSFLISVNSKIRFIGEMAMNYSYGPLGRNCTKIFLNGRSESIAGMVTLLNSVIMLDKYAGSRRFKLLRKSRS